MYNLKDYMLNGMHYVNNSIRPRHKRLSQLMIYATTACQSRCRHCSIWRKPHEHLSPNDIQLLMQSRCITRFTTVGLEGGEFILHPQAASILQWFSVHHRNFTLLSNGLAPDLLADYVQRFPPRHLYLSLDEPRETYQRMRGIDGYNRLVQSIERLHRQVPISLMFCLSPWNSFDDLCHVADVALHYNIDLRIGIYSTMSFFGTTRDLLPADSFTSRIPEIIRHTDQNYEHLALYEQWRSGHLNIPCHSIRSQLVVHSNGDIPLCQNLDVVLGNIHRTPLDAIFNSKQTCNIQRAYGKNCNGCWINFHRKYDTILLSNLERVAPKAFLEKLFGSYQWCADPSCSYRQHIKSIASCSKT
ncbi:MAG: radical SAM protein [Bacteroidales bacterium]|nr:radical SAM protein [Bacteroidales bacterium]